MGLARGALEDFALLASERTTSSTVPLRDRPEIQLEYGRAEAITAGARAACLSAIDTAWEAFADPDNVPADLDRILAYARLAITSALTEAVRAIDILLRAAGTAGVFRTAGLERRFRDVHVAAQHAAGQDLHIRDAGRVLLGIHTGVPYV